MRWGILAITLAGCAFDLRAGSTPPADDARAADDVVIENGECPDGDGDGACDVQTWVCGTQPAAPADPLALARDLGDPRPKAGAKVAQVAPVYVVARAGATLQIGLDVQLTVDCHDKVCGVPLAYGLAGLGRAGCAFDDARFDQWTAQAPVTVPVAVPVVEGAYALRATVDFPDACGTTTSWYVGEPDTAATFAHVCVP